MAFGTGLIDSGCSWLSAAPISLKIGAELAEPSIIAGGPRHQHWLDLDLCRMLDVAGLSRSAMTQPVRDGPPIFLVKLRDECILRSSHVARHSQVASLLQENRTMSH